MFHIQNTLCLLISVDNDIQLNFYCSHDSPYLHTLQPVQTAKRIPKIQPINIC